MLLKKMIKKATRKAISNMVVLAGDIPNHINFDKRNDVNGINNIKGRILTYKVENNNKDIFFQDAMTGEPLMFIHSVNYIAGDDKSLSIYLDDIKINFNILTNTNYNNIAGVEVIGGLAAKAKQYIQRP